MPDPEERSLQPVPLFEALQRHGVRYVAVGSFAAIAQGISLPMTDLDIVPATDDANKQRLVACLDELGAEERVGTERRPIDELRSYPETLTADSFRMFSTRYGELDVVLHPSGFTRGYDDLIERAVIVALQAGDGSNSTVVEALIANVEDVYESKRQAGRRKDIEALPAFSGIHLQDARDALRARYRQDVARRRDDQGDPGSVETP